MAEAGFGPARRGLVQFAQRLPNLNLGEPVLVQSGLNLPNLKRGLVRCWFSGQIRRRPKSCCSCIIQNVPLPRPEDNASNSRAHPTLLEAIKEAPLAVNGRAINY